MRMPWIVAIVSVMGTVAGAGESSDGVREGPRIIAPRDLQVGHRVADLAFFDLDDKPGRLSDYRDARAIVICMTGVGCPVSKKFGPTLVELEARYRKSGVIFLAVNPSTSESTEKVKLFVAEAKSKGWQGRYIADRQGMFGRELAVTTTTEAFVLDRARTLVYRGAVDDQYGIGYALPEPRHRYLEKAIEAVLSDQPPAIAATTAPGCALTFAPARAIDTPLTYHNRISRIVQNHCQECHRPGENAPFELMSFEDVKGNSAMIRKVVSKRTMPPWFADPKTAHAFKNDRSLSDRDIDDIIKWVEAGCPEGNPSDAPVARAWEKGWRIGKPDLILQAAKEQRIPAKGTIPYRYVFVPTNLTEDKWITAIEVRPSTPEVVHHLLVFTAFGPGDPRARAALRQFQGGLKGYFAGMVPGQGDITFPEGAAKLLPKGAILAFQIHYTANGKETTDQPRIAFRFADKAPQYEVKTSAASNRYFVIPPNAPNHELKASHTFFAPTRLLSVNPHSHVRGKAFKYELVYPDGKTDVILNVPRYDFNWQIEYQFAAPIDVPAGTRLQVTGWYDNSKDNPANPNPNVEVKFGEQTWNEMMIGYFTGHLLKA